jgi:hypothetical protein
MIFLLILLGIKFRKDLFIKWNIYIDYSR